MGSICQKTINIDREEWDSMEDYEKDELMLEQLLQGSLHDWGYEEIQ